MYFLRHLCFLLSISFRWERHNFFMDSSCSIHVKNHAFPKLDFEVLVFGLILMRSWDVQHHAQHIRCCHHVDDISELTFLSVIKPLLQQGNNDEISILIAKNKNAARCARCVACRSGQNTFGQVLIPHACSEFFEQSHKSHLHTRCNRNGPASQSSFRKPQRSKYSLVGKH